MVPVLARATDAVAEALAVDITLTPHAADAANSYMGVSMTLHQPRIKAGGILLRMPLKIVGIPTSRLVDDVIKSSDERGPLSLLAEDEPSTPVQVARHWKVTRATVGDVHVVYRALPRHVTSATNNGPLFDLRYESGGFMGAGVGFIAAPVKEGLYHVRLAWDLSQVAPGSRGVWTYGQGPVEVDIPAEMLSFSYFAAGPLSSVPPKGDEKFGVYWLTEPPFPATALGQRLRELFTGLARFFRDDDLEYRVFIRQNPYEGQGGSALGRSFMFGYNAAEKPTVDSLLLLLAHEQTHLWPMLEGEHADTAWYSEGNADYYSALEAYRLGLLTTDKFLETMNQHADDYYTNPYIKLSNPEAAKIFWTDPIAQTVPYGRGFVYLANTDAAIRAKSGGKRSLDDIVVELHMRDTRHERHGIPEWLELVGRELGAEEAKRTYDAMVAGNLQELNAAAFAPCFKVEAREVPQFQLGFSRASLNDDRIVRELDPNSTAAKAGLHEGDKLLDVKGLVEARKHFDRAITLTVDRPEGPITIGFVPRGPLVRGYHWSRNSVADASTCKF